MDLRKLNEDANSITLGWDSVPGAIGYRFQSSTTAPKWSSTFDASRTQVKFSKASSYKVQALMVANEGVYPPLTPPTGTLYFDGNMEVANVLSQWDSIANGNPNRVFTTTAQNGVTPRHGSRMLRCDAWPGEYASWSAPTLQAAIVQKNIGQGPFALGADTYCGGSFYIVPGYLYTNAVAHNTFVEYHGVGPMSQAPIHFGVLGNGDPGRIFIDLFRDVGGYNPVFGQPNLGHISTLIGHWTDYIIRVKWTNDATGKVTIWFKEANGQPMTSANLKYDYTGPTAPISGEARYSVLGIYRGSQSTLGTVYHDSYKVGTTLAIVDPANYD